MIPVFTLVKLNKQLSVFLSNMLIFYISLYNLLGTYNFKLSYMPCRERTFQLSGNHTQGSFLTGINFIRF